MKTKPETRPAPKSSGAMAFGGVLSGLGAVIGASCCILPMALINLGVSSALVGNLAFFARAKPWLMGAAGLFILAALAAAFWGGRKPNAKVLILLAAASGFVAGAYALPFYEPVILEWMNLR